MCDLQSFICKESTVKIALTVIPIQEEERERAHNEEEEDPYPEASVVFDCLLKEVHKMTFS